MRMIDADALRKEICSLYKTLVIIGGMNEDALRNWFCSTVERIDRTPTIDAVEVVHGRWRGIVVDQRHQITCDECSVCGFKYGGLGIEAFRYCPNCGAKMDGKEG